MINIKSIWESHKPSDEVIIKTRIDSIPNLHCFGATNHITGQVLYIMYISKYVIIPDLNKYRFKGIEIYTLPNESQNTIDLYIYLLDNELKEVFSLFIQNILDEIQLIDVEFEALTTTLNIVSKWKRLFDKINFNGLTLEKQKGLIGELLFLNYLLNSEKLSSGVVNYWTGTEYEFEAKDFTLGSIGIEIKFTSAKQPKLKISNERQLDSENLKDLFVVLYSTEAVKENGFSLISLIDQSRLKISTEEELMLFNNKLNQYGYFDDDRENYFKMYSLKNIFVFNITMNFPKIIKNQLPLGIYETSYSIEISAVENFIVEMEEILANI